ncbi:unnamed protein product [Cladocopium goreaui]|uniref:Pentacotripeptide-repeat region of PRORP domain-containing protein n=1 Tax=Cladocopium goreaui TaxID=2562237 RepID=A0A9P1FIN4_9DINO|nr:unnamed protein product [Cladocopium goreaui]
MTATSFLMKAKVAQRIVTHNTTIMALANESSWREALAVLEGMQQQKLQPNLASYLCSLGALREAKQWQLAIHWLRRQCPHDVESFNAVLAVCEAAAQWERALQLCTGAGKTTSTDLVGFNTLISACARGSEWQQCLRLLSSRQSDVIGFNSTLSALAAARCWDHALALLQTMRDPLPNVVSYNTTISACADCEGEEWEHAMGLLTQMQLDNLQPDRISFNSLMAVTKSWSLCLLILEETMASADATTFATALHVLGTAGQWRRCLEILQQMQGPDLMASMAVFHAAHVASASLLCWALRGAMVKAFNHTLADVAGSVRRRLRVEATMQLGKLESCVCAWQGGGRHQLMGLMDATAALAQLGGKFPSQAGHLRHPHNLEAFLLLPPVAARHLAEAKHLWGSPGAPLSRLVIGVADAQKKDVIHPGALIHHGMKMDILVGLQVQQAKQPSRWCGSST